MNKANSRFPDWGSIFRRPCPWRRQPRTERPKMSIGGTAFDSLTKGDLVAIYRNPAAVALRARTAKYCAQPLPGEKA